MCCSQHRTGCSRAGTATEVAGNLATGPTITTEVKQVLAARSSLFTQDTLLQKASSKSLETPLRSWDRKGWPRTVGRLWAFSRTPRNPFWNSSLFFEEREMRGPQDGECGCGGRIEFRQRRDFQLHTVLAGQDVDVWIQYGQCESCRKGWFPLLSKMRIDREGFTQSLQELSTLAGVMEPYGPASEELLGRFTGVKVSSEKIQSMVRQEGKKASTFLKPLTTGCGDPRQAGGIGEVFVAASLCRWG